MLAVETGADAVGFVFYEKSPRCVTVEAAREIAKKLPEGIEKVGVFVDQDCRQIREVVSGAKLTAVQLHGDSSIESYSHESRPATECIGAAKVIEAVGAKRLLEGTGVRVRNRGRYFAVLVDHQANGAVGGTGQKFDWEENSVMVRALGLMIPVVIAGGLNASNVRDAISTFEPFGVDVVSGVEERPGKKDPEKVRAFVRAVREFDRRAG